jgi:uncharacterized protein YigA (DUF484 family)
MPNQTPILEAEVINYLESHPDFFSRHLELLGNINIPHQTGQAVSLVEKQMQILRKSNGDLKARFSQLMEIARQNENHFENTKQLVLELLDFHLRQEDLNALIKIFDNQFPNALAANEYRLILLDYTSNQPLPKKVLSLQSKDLKEKAPRLINMEKSFCGGLTKSEKDFLFGEPCPLIASCAIIPLRYKNLNALIAIGNFNDQHFYKGMGTMFLDHIGDVVSRILDDLINKKVQQSIAV